MPPFFALRKPPATRAGLPGGVGLVTWWGALVCMSGPLAGLKLGHAGNGQRVKFPAYAVAQDDGRICPGGA